MSAQCEAASGYLTDNYNQDIETMPCAAPGGSSIQVTTPCDTGTLTLRSYPQGNGVGLTETLTHVPGRQWYAQPYITPYLDPGGELSGALHTVDANGDLTITDDNHSTHDGLAHHWNGPKVPYTWPQGAEVDAFGKGSSGGYCSASVYLNATEASANTPGLWVLVDRSGKVEVNDFAHRAPGIWTVSVTTTAPPGTQHKTRVVKTKKLGGYPTTYQFKTTVGGFTNLRNFTSVAVTASEGGKNATWLTLTRTP